MNIISLIGFSHLWKAPTLLFKCIYMYFSESTVTTDQLYIVFIVYVLFGLFKSHDHIKIFIL